MSKAIWIDGTYCGYRATEETGSDQQVGQMGYLIETTSYRNGTVTKYQLANRPQHTNRSHEPRLHGWCGETDNISRSAMGVWEVVRVAQNGRVQIREITDPERIKAYLDETGFPQLADEIEVAA